MSTTADAVIIGGGIMDMSTAMGVTSRAYGQKWQPQQRARWHVLSREGGDVATAVCGRRAPNWGWDLYPKDGDPTLARICKACMVELAATSTDPTGMTLARD